MMKIYLLTLLFTNFNAEILIIWLRKKINILSIEEFLKRTLQFFKSEFILQCHNITQPLQISVDFISDVNLSYETHGHLLIVRFTRIAIKLVFVRITICFKQTCSFYSRHVRITYYNFS